MCGLFGVAGPGISMVDLKIFDELMLVSSLRGTDGTGVAVGTFYNKRPDVFKINGDCIYWRYSANEDKISKKIYSVQNLYLMGHTRHRTTGDKGPNGAQPYIFESIVGTHNGTLSGKFDGFFTDSHAFLNKVDTKGIQSAVDTTKTDDAMALVWIEKNNQILHFYRNEERTLYFAYAEKRNVLYWASELWMLQGILGRNDVDYDAYTTRPHFHYAIKLKEINNKDKNKKLFSEEIKPPPVVEDKTQNDLKDIPWMKGPDDGLTHEQRERLLH